MICKSMAFLPTGLPISWCLGNPSRNHPWAILPISLESSSRIKTCICNSKAERNKNLMKGKDKMVEMFIGTQYVFPALGNRKLSGKDII